MALKKRYMAEQEKQDYRVALLCCAILEPHRDRKKHPKPFSPAEFMPQKQNPRRPQTWQEQLRIVELWNAALGGRDERGDNCAGCRGNGKNGY